MPPHVKFNIDNYLKNIHDIRVYNFYRRFLYLNGMQISDVNYYTDIDSCRREITHIFDCADMVTQEKKDLLMRMEIAREKEILPLHEFGWLHNDERATFWLCSYLFYSDNYNKMITGIENSFIQNASIMPGTIQYPPNEYNSLGFHDVPDSHNGRVERIIRFFDTLTQFPYHKDKTNMTANLLMKDQVLFNFKDKWKSIYQKPLPVKWLPNQEEAVSWAWDFLKKHVDNCAIKGQFECDVPHVTRSFVQNTKPLNHAERLLSVRAAFDLWEGNDDRKKLLLMNFNKAWNQKKLRETRVDKKALNTYLKTKTKMQLDELAEHYDMRISDTLEKLITQHYKQLFQGK
ncbi:hypothetical protein RCT29_05925 [Escherichia coli]|nr:hypothetical protein [Escherichia coli]